MMSKLDRDIFSKFSKIRNAFIFGVLSEPGIKACLNDFWYLFQIKVLNELIQISKRFYFKMHYTPRRLWRPVQTASATFVQNLVQQMLKKSWNRVAFFVFLAPLSCAAEMRALPAAFSLAEPMKDPGNQMPTASYTFGKDANSYSDWDW